ncbi:TIGR02302 family protein [Oryzifoliimicrobium ureilyticus]|uniref:TIGR02302 family protein n=1 Tax=Oryzifoliimicrobium ureilyticus TaxID=3113724 RepID=UPI0030762445
MVAAKRFVAKLVLTAEQLAPFALALACVIALYLSLSWFGVFRFGADWLRYALLFICALGLAACLLPLRKLKWPSTNAADRLLEERNGLAHQPVSVQEDEPAFDTPFARALWREHQTRMAARIANLDAGFPKPDIAGLDRWGLRAIPALMVFIAFGYSLSVNGGTAVDAFLPRVGSPNTDPGVRIDAWVTPPSYTGKAPIYLATTVSDSAPIKVPQYSLATVRVSGSKTPEKVTFRKANGQTEEIAAANPEDVQAQTPAGAPPQAQATPVKANTNNPSADAQGLAAASYLLKLSDNGTVTVNGKSWLFEVVPDKAPEIAFDGMPKATVTGALEIGFTAKDDYGVDQAYAEIVPADADAGAEPLYPLPDFRLDLPRRDPRNIKAVTSRNINEHPLSGKRVRVTLVAKDASGQIGRSPPHEMVLPAKPFAEPLAAAIAEERQVFALDKRQMPQAIALNESLTLRPEETIPNLTHYLLIESAKNRMKLAKTDQAMKDTADYLWDIALGIEDGELSDAERNLRNAQQKLSDALNRNASDEDIKKAMEELRKAMREYMKELAERMRNAPQSNQTARNVLRQQDLERMMNQMEDLARSGNRDAAQQMLSELNRMMNNLQAGRPQRGGQQQQGDNSQMRQQMDKLGSILRDQQKLMEETFKLDQQLKDRMQRGDPRFGMNDPLLQDQPMDNDGLPLDNLPPMQQDQSQNPQDQGQQGQQQGQNGQPREDPNNQMTQEQLREALKQLRSRQDDLAKQLGELQKNLGKMGVKPGQGFPQAQREMEGAGRELGDGRSDPAVQGQGRALEALRQGTRDMMNQMMQAMRGQQGNQGPNGQVGQGNQDGRDILGRETGGTQQDGDPRNMIPNEIDAQRAREILDAIREKLGNNPAGVLERQYLERLLDLQ